MVTSILTNVVTFAFLASLATALDLNPLANAHSSGPTTVTWQRAPADTLFSLFLHHITFGNDLAIANNVNPAASPLGITLPVVPPQDGYTLRATNVTNINEVFSESSPFAIGAEVEVSSTTTSISTSATSTDPSSSTVSGVATSVPTNRPTTTSAFGSTVSNANTNTNSRSTGTGTSTGTSAANTATRTGTNSNATPPRFAFDFSAWSVFVVVLCALAGGAVTGTAV